MLELMSIGVVLALLTLWRWRGRRAASEDGWLPAELQRGRLVYAEKTFRVPGEAGLSGRPDRVYRIAWGRLVLVEFKTRHVNLTYPSDVIELSAQRVALMAQTGKRVAEYGYIVVQDRKRRRFVHRVTLLSKSEVDSLVQRRTAILEGRLQPRGPNQPGLCRQCSFAPGCALKPQRPEPGARQTSSGFFARRADSPAEADQRDTSSPRGR